MLQLGTLPTFSAAAPSLTVNLVTSVDPSVDLVMSVDLVTSVNLDPTVDPSVHLVDPVDLVLTVDLELREADLLGRLPPAACSSAGLGPRRCGESVVQPQLSQLPQLSRTLSQRQLLPQLPRQLFPQLSRQLLPELSRQLLPLLPQLERDGARRVTLPSLHCRPQLAWLDGREPQLAGLDARREP